MKKHKISDNTVQNLLSFITVIISFIALFISIKGYNSQNSKDLPLLQLKYCTVKMAISKPLLHEGNKSDYREDYFNNYFYKPLREAIDEKLQIFETSAVKSTDNYVLFESLEFVLIENIHSAAAGKLILELKERKCSYLPIEQLDETAKSQGICQILMPNRYMNHPIEDNFIQEVIELPGLKSGEIVAIPIRLLYPTKAGKNVDKIFDEKTQYTEILIEKVKYFNEDLSKKSYFIPRPRLENPVLISDSYYVNIKSYKGNQ